MYFSQEILLVFSCLIDVNENEQNHDQPMNNEITDYTHSYTEKMLGQLYNFEAYKEVFKPDSNFTIDFKFLTAHMVVGTNDIFLISPFFIFLSIL